jgi:hypothetical protein
MLAVAVGMANVAEMILERLPLLETLSVLAMKHHLSVILLLTGLVVMQALIVFIVVVVIPNISFILSVVVQIYFVTQTNGMTVIIQAQYVVLVIVV